MQSKFIRILIIINGILLPIFISIGLYQISKDLFRSKNHFNELDGIIVGEELGKAKEKGLALQGLTYERPESIGNSTNMYVPLSALTYEEAMQVKQAASSAGDMAQYFFNYFNIVFLDKDYNVIGTLLDKKATIIDISTPYTRSEKDTVIIKNIAYKIGFEDTNQDGLLDYKDKCDLYISDIAGKNLTQVTDGVDIEQYYFDRNNTEIFIVYKERTNQREEHKRKKFARYIIAENKLMSLGNFDKQIDRIESSLIR